jgi:hypothetical protein
VAKVARDRAGNRYAQIDPRVQRRRERGRPAAAGQAHHNYPLVTQHLHNAVLFIGLFKRMSGSESRKQNENERLDLATANCIIIAQILQYSYCFQGQFCKLSLLRVIFNGKLGDYYAIRSKRTCFA